MRIRRYDQKEEKGGTDGRFERVAAGESRSESVDQFGQFVVTRIRAGARRRVVYYRVHRRCILENNFLERVRT